MLLYSSTQFFIFSGCNPEDLVDPNEWEFEFTINPHGPTIPPGGVQEFEIKVIENSPNYIGLHLVNGSSPPFIRDYMTFNFNPPAFETGHWTSILTITVPDSVPAGEYTSLIEFKNLDNPDAYLKYGNLSVFVSSSQLFTINLTLDQINLLPGVSDTVRINVNKGIGFNESIIFSSNSISGITFLDSQNGYTVGSGGIIYATGNGGTSWNSVSPGVSENLHAVSIKDLLAIAVGDLGKVVINSGSGWQAENTGVGGIGALYGICVLNEQNAVAVGYTGGSGKIIRRK